MKITRLILIAMMFSQGLFAATLQRAEIQLLKDMPVVPSYYYVSRHSVKPKVTGYEPNVRGIHLSHYPGVETTTP